MNNLLSQPQFVDTLSESDRLLFSSYFIHDWASIRDQARLVEGDKIYLFGSRSEDEMIHLPDAYNQFLPAIRIAVDHEKSIRGGLQLQNALLTVRQCDVRAGHSQQGVSRNEAHRDSTDHVHLYTVADISPTQYFPHIESTEDTPTELRLSDEDLENAVAFQPYDIVWAPGMTYHHSTQLEEQTRRTFLRLAFTYDHKAY